MIRGIRGLLQEIGLDWVMVGIGGVTVRVFVPSSVIDGLGVIGSEIHLHTHLQSREDGLNLYGFTSSKTLVLFESLLGISGIGPRLALAILTSFNPEDLKLAIASGDETSLAKAPGVGKRTAARIILELRGKLDQVTDADGGSIDTVGNDVLGALIALGYSQSEAYLAMRKLPKDSNLTMEDQVRLVLQSMANP